jgi:uncharacterized membrane protein YdjX (TVP38/TMEM64 family)
MARWIRPGLLVLLVGAGIAVAATVGVPPLAQVRTWVAAAGWAGPVLYAGLFALASLTPAPASVLTVGAGALFGWAVGTPVAFAGALVGALAGFGMARTLGRSTVEGLGGQRLARLDAMLRERGLLAVIGIRLVPLGPAAMVNAACGLTAVRTRDYVTGTAIGLLPGIVTFVAFGAFGTQPGSAPFLLAVLALALLIGVGVVTNRRRAGSHPEQEPGRTRVEQGEHAS